jgi:hypothetical protein
MTNYVVSTDSADNAHAERVLPSAAVTSTGVPRPSTSLLIAPVPPNGLQ